MYVAMVATCPAGCTEAGYVSQRSYMAVPDCPVLYIHHFKVGHDVRGQSWTVRMSVVVRYN